MEITFSARDLRSGAHIFVNFEEQFSVTDIRGWYESGLFTMENVIIMYLSILLDISEIFLSGEFIHNYFKIFNFLLILGKNLGSIPAAR